MKVQSEPLPGEEAWIPSPVEPDMLWPRRKIFGGDATWTRIPGQDASGVLDLHRGAD
jgi:hypothetical protein